MDVPASELERLFDTIPDVVFFVKDRNKAYTHVNSTLLRRLRLQSRRDIVGRSAVELFPAPFGDAYTAQDTRVLAGEVIDDQLELHLFPSHAPGWCLTCKRPLVDRRGRIVGLVGTSRDLGKPDVRHSAYSSLKTVLNHLHLHYAEVVRVETLSRLAGFSVAQLERHCLHVFQLSPRQILTKIRIEAAARLLRGSERIATIGIACGYSDQSAFSRQFKNMVGVTPGQYRTLARSRVATDHGSLAN
jgi:AraC-like DNA-binding protein